MERAEKPGAEALAAKGWWGANKWLVLRRVTQLAVLALFLAGPWFGVWIVKGNIASSLTLEVLPLSDPYVLLQTLAAGHWPVTTALIGAAIVLGFYFLFGGRVYCAWVCPINIVTDAAAWLRERLGIRGGIVFARQSRYWILAMSLLAAFVTGTAVWELINPVTTVYRGLIFGMGLAWWIILAIFLFDLIVSKRGWCGHLCPQGAFYSLLAVYAPLRVSATRRAQCNDCMDCFAVCPEPQVIPPALKGEQKGVSPLIDGINCTNCARCIDVCSKDVFEITTRFSNKTKTINLAQQREALP